MVNFKQNLVRSTTKMKTVNWIGNMQKIGIWIEHWTVNGSWFEGISKGVIIGPMQITLNPTKELRIFLFHKYPSYGIITLLYNYVKHL